jgi:iron complex outermembrane receptor protein
MKITRIITIASVTTSLFTISPSAYSVEENFDPSSVSLEELMDTQIYSASKRPEKISETPASVYILTAEDIKRSGVTSIPEALRLVPGVNVAQTNANTWAISIRGFNRQFSNKLLVMIDGRTVYTPLFSGVWWDSQDYILEDIERIEVVKGPGGTLWGANAVNGVINIITKEARKTQGNYVSFTAGTGGEGIISYRYGGKIGKAGADNFYRVYAKAQNYEELPSVANNADNNDNWKKGQSGFRYDFRDHDFNKVTLQGDFFSGRKAYPLTLPTTGNVLSFDDFTGGNVMLKWNLPSDGYNTDLQTYIDYSNRDQSPVLKQEIVTYDVDLQTQHDWGIHSFIGGTEARVIQYDLTNSPYPIYSPESDNNYILSAFLQDKISLIEKKLFLTLGSKFDYNNYTQFDIQPNARLLYQIDDSNSVWAAISHAVRTPSIGENSLARQSISGYPLGAVNIMGSTDYGSEKLNAYEIGYRTDITNNLFFDISAFYNHYYDLRTFEGAGFPLNLVARNNGTGETYGIESYAIYGATKKWDIKLGHSFLLQYFHENTTDTGLQKDEERSPENQFTLGSYYKLSDNINWDTNLYYVSNLHYYTNGTPSVRTKIPAYARLDTQIRWQAAKDLELSLIGQNLTDDKHQEFDEVIFSTPSYMSRAVLARVTYKW